MRALKKEVRDLPLNRLRGTSQREAHFREGDRSAGRSGCNDVPELRDCRTFAPPGTGLLGARAVTMRRRPVIVEHPLLRGLVCWALGL
jgi:hypothetical protein